MSRSSASFVLGYHGCDQKDGERFLSGAEKMKPGFEPYHWLGPGIYFWENDPVRALEWAREKKERGACENPFVIGAIIDLGDCLDFQVRENVLLLKEAYESFVSIQQTAGVPLPTNKKARNDKSEAKVLRFLDFAVINHLLSTTDETETSFDTVRGVFGEGEYAYPGSGILERSHAQIAVRTDKSLKGLFRPLLPA